MAPSIYQCLTTECSVSHEARNKVSFVTKICKGLSVRVVKDCYFVIGQYIGKGGPYTALIINQLDGRQEKVGLESYVPMNEGYCWLVI